MRSRSRRITSRSMRRWRRTTSSLTRRTRTRSRSCSKPLRWVTGPRPGRRRLSVTTHEPPAGAVDVILRDGSTLRLRAPVADDAGALAAFFSGLSERSFYLRFHGLRRVDRTLIEHFVEPDWNDRGVLVGVAGETRIVAVAEFMRLRDETSAEVAFAVADELQGRGIGTRLLEQLAARAAAVGIERFVAEVLPENAAMLGVFRDAGFEVARELQGCAYPVNREGEAVGGVRGYRSLEELPETVDLAVICLPAQHVLGSAEEALAQGIRALCVISSGFAEVGTEGAERQERLLGLVRAHGGRLVGPNCLGIAIPPLGLNATFGPRPLPPGPIAFSSQSGALGLALLEKAAERRLGFSAFVSVGNKADVSSNDLLEWWEDDEASELVLLYLESFGNPGKFSRLARRVARQKPILALKSGTTNAGARAASSHTAALAGSDAAVEALFLQAGVLRARTLEELVDAASLLSSQPLPQGRRVGVLTNAGGLGILCADACESAGLDLPELSEDTRAALAELVPSDASLANPVDMLGSATAASYAAAIPPLLGDKRLDALIVLFVPPVVAGADEVAEAIRETVAGFDADKPVLAVVISAGGTPAAPPEAGSPVAAFPYPESAARALGLAASRSEWLRRRAGTAAALDGVDRAAGRRIVDAALATGGGWLAPQLAAALFEAYGVPLVPERPADSADEAIAAARALGFPVVVKTAAAGAHKTESGGVALDLRDEEQVRAAAQRIGPPVIVQAQVRGGAELLAGVVQDPVFGPLVAFGPGGVLAELIGAAAFRLAPLDEVDAQELVLGGKAGRLVRGFRGAPPADVEALVDLVLRLSALAEDLPEVAELDLNPLFGLSRGCLALDALVRIAPADVRRSPKTW